MLYVIRRKKDGALVTGTDYRYYPHHQILKYPTKPPLIISDYDGELPESIQAEIKHRGINLKYYEIVPIEIKQMLTSEPTGQSKASTLLFEFSEGQNYEEVGHFLIRANNVYKNTTSAPKTILRMPFTQYISPRMGNDVAQVSEWFGKLELSDKKNLVVQAMQEFDSSIVDVSTIVSNGFAQLYAKVNNKLLPLKILGDGTNRLLLMQLAILAKPNGIILIDEIENGFHYSVLPTLWKTLFSAAKLANCQIIATTHSYECIQNAIDYATRNSEEDRFGFVRLEKRNEDVCAKPFSINALDYAVKSEIEVR